MADIYRAREAFSFTSKGNGLPRIVTPGSLMSSDDPDFKGKEHFFEKVDVSVAREKVTRDRGAVENATAEPGERRSLSTPKRRGNKPQAAQEDPKPDTAKADAPKDGE